MQFRQSSLKKWSLCPLQAHLNETVTQPARISGKAVFGTIIHHVLERYNSGLSVDSCVSLFRELWDDPSRLTESPNYWPRYTTFGGLRTRGVDIIKDYDSKNRWESRQIVASEHRFLVPFGDHELQGTVDHVEIRKSGKGQRVLRIVDFKTAGKKPTFVELRLDIQFTTYVYASLQEEFWVGNGSDYPGIPDGKKLFDSLQKVKRRGVWYHLMTNQELDAGERDDGDFMRLYRLVNEIERARKAEIFVPHIGDACTFCDHTAHCGITIPDSDLVELGEA